MKTLIGLTGQKYSGKDTTATYISKFTDYPIYAFAKPLKEFCKSYFDLNKEELYGSLKEKNRTFNLKSWRNLLESTLDFYFPEFYNSYDKEFFCEEFYRKVLLPYLIGENQKLQTARIIASPREIMQRVGTNFFRNIKPTFWLDQAEKKLEETRALIIADVRFDNEAQWIKNHNGIIIKVLKNLDNKDSHISEQGISKKYIDVNIENNGSFEELENGVRILIEHKIFESNTLSLNDFL